MVTAPDELRQYASRDCADLLTEGSVMRPLRAAIVLGLLVGMQGASSLAQVPKPDPLRGDGRVSEFYTWSGELSGPPGWLLRSEPLPATLGLANAASQERILYTSTDGVEGKSLIAVSGALFIPKGTPPQEGWPLLAWPWHGWDRRYLRAIMAS